MITICIALLICCLAIVFLCVKNIRKTLDAYAIALDENNKGFNRHEELKAHRQDLTAYITFLLFFLFLACFFVFTIKNSLCI